MNCGFVQGLEEKERRKKEKRDRETEDVCVNGRRQQKENLLWEIVVNKLTTQEREKAN